MDLGIPPLSIENLSNLSIPYINTCIHAYIHTCINACMHTCIYAYRHAYMHTYTHAYMHAYIQVKPLRALVLVLVSSSRLSPGHNFGGQYCSSRCPRATISEDNTAPRFRGVFGDPHQGATSPPPPQHDLVRATHKTAHASAGGSATPPPQNFLGPPPLVPPPQAGGDGPGPPRGQAAGSPTEDLQPQTRSINPRDF